MVYDVAVIGAGVIGALSARELCKSGMKVVLLERCNDVAMGTTKANSAIVHAGYDAQPGTLKAKLNVEGTAKMQQLCRDLSVPFRQTGSLVIAFCEREMKTLEELLERGRKNSVPGLRLLSKEELKKAEPQISNEAVGALLAPSAGIICPYELTIAAAENAIENGADYIRNFEVVKIEDNAGVFTIEAASGESVQAKAALNAAGVYCDEIAALIGDNSIKTIPRKGEYMLMDKSMGRLSGHVVFQCPNEMGKGVLVTPTVDGNLLAGPTSVDIEDKEDVSTTDEGLADVLKKVAKSFPSISGREVITSFAGLRAHPEGDDFIVEKSKKNSRFINAAGIESPGLSSAPAIAEMAAELLKSEIPCDEKQDFNPKRKPPVRFREMSNEERAELIKQNSAYGRVVCRCETVTEGEIKDAINAPGGARDVDGVKRRTRAGMGRCQGGFCGSKVLELLAKELSLPPEEITKSGGSSQILTGKTK